MQEIAQETFTYLQGSYWVSFMIALIAGLAAVKTVAYDQRAGGVLFLIVGLLGLFLGEFVLFWLNLDEYLEQLAAMRIVFDFIAAYVGSFIIAAIIHFVKPT